MKTDLQLAGETAIVVNAAELVRRITLKGVGEEVASQLVGVDAQTIAGELTVATLSKQLSTEVL